MCVLLTQHLVPTEEERCACRGLCLCVYLCVHTYVNTSKCQMFAGLTDSY